MPARLPIDAIPTLPTVLAVPGSLETRDAQADGMSDLIIAMSGGRRVSRA